MSDDTRKEQQGKEQTEDVLLLLEGAVDYRVYQITAADIVKWFLMGLTVTAAVMYIFYERWYISLAAGILGGIVFIPVNRKRFIEKRQKLLTMQFKEMLESVKSSLGTDSVYDAFMKAREDLAVQFPNDAYIMRELEILMQGTMLKMKLEDLLLNFAERSGVEDIQNFATVFKTCYSRGGNMQEIVGRSIMLINEKIEVDMEIATMIAGQKNEQSILLVLPVVFVIMLKAMGGMVDMSSVAGIISMTIAIVIFLLAYIISKKIMKIEI